MDKIIVYMFFQIVEFSIHYCKVHGLDKFDKALILRTYNNMFSSIYKILNNDALRLQEMIKELQKNINAEIIKGNKPPMKLIEQYMLKFQSIDKNLRTIKGKN